MSQKLFHSTNIQYPRMKKYVKNLQTLFIHEPPVPLTQSQHLFTKVSPQKSPVRSPSSLKLKSTRHKIIRSEFQPHEIRKNNRPFSMENVRKTFRENRKALVSPETIQT